MGDEGGMTGEGGSSTLHPLQVFDGRNLGMRVCVSASDNTCRSVWSLWLGFGDWSSGMRLVHPFPSPSFLAAKNLPAAIEDTGGEELPESIREKAESVQGQGGVKAIEEKFYNLPEQLQRNREILNEVGKGLMMLILRLYVDVRKGLKGRGERLTLG